MPVPRALARVLCSTTVRLGFPEEEKGERDGHSGDKADSVRWLLGGFLPGKTIIVLNSAKTIVFHFPWPGPALGAVG